MVFHQDRESFCNPYVLALCEFRRSFMKVNVIILLLLCQLQAENLLS